MTFYILAVLIGIVAGIRTFTALAAVAWAAWFGELNLSDGLLAFLGYHWSPWVFSVAAIGEFALDKLPSTSGPSMRQRFFLRMLSGATCGAAIGSIHDLAVEGMGWGVAGAVAGSWIAATLRGRLATLFNDDRPAGLVGDMLAIGGAAAAVAAL